jgi:flagellar hook-basal body complex protein FliE
MDPLSALSGLGNIGNVGSVNLPVTPTTPAMPGAPVTEGFGQMLGAQSPGAMPAVPTLDGGSSASTWGHMAQQMVLNVSNQQQSAAAQVNDVLRGGPTPVHQAMIATEEAGLSFEFLAQVRNKLVDAYQQIMQMQV